MKARSLSEALPHPERFPLRKQLKTVLGVDHLEEQMDSVYFQSSFLIVFISH